MVVPGMYVNFPNKLASFLSQSGFMANEMVTFCAWFLYETGKWQTSELRINEWGIDQEELSYLKNPIWDGSDDFFDSYFTVNGADYVNKFHEYYEETDFTDELKAFVHKVFEYQSLTIDEVLTLFPDVDAQQLQEELNVINYPTH